MSDNEHDIADDSIVSDSDSNSTANTDEVMFGYQPGDLTYNNRPFITNGTGVTTQPQSNIGSSIITSSNIASGGNTAAGNNASNFINFITTGPGSGAYASSYRHNILAGSGSTFIGSNTNTQIGGAVTWSRGANQQPSSPFREPISYDDIAKLLVKVDELEQTVKDLADSNNKLVDIVNSITHHPTFGTLTIVDKSGFKRAMLRQRSQ